MHGDGAGQGGPEELQGLLHDRRDAEGAPLPFPVMAEGDDLLDQLLAPLGRLEDERQGFPGRAAFLGVEEGQLGVDRDGGQDVVEIVGDASGQGPQGLHLLGLAHLFLKGDLLGDVPLRDEDAREGP